MNAWLVFAGAYLILDGIGSIWLYRKQTLPEHLVRIARATVGLGILMTGVLSNAK